MTTLLRLMLNPVYLLPANNGGSDLFVQPLAEALDVGTYDQLDLQFSLFSLEGGGGVTFSILTSMQNKSDGDEWEVLGTVSLPISGVPAFRATTFPTPILATTTTVPVPLLRYIRWKVVLTGGATAATVQIQGIARRKAL